jgi:hypothetical protein
MFGKPEWFRPKRIGWGLVPITWQGWAYTAGWVLVIAAPFWVLTERHQPVEATTWLLFGIAALVYDVREILRGIRNPAAATSATAVNSGPAPQKDDSILYIHDSAVATAPVATRNYRLRLK